MGASDLQYQPTCVCSDNEVDIYKHRSQTVAFDINDPNDVLGDITGAKAWYSVKSDEDDADADAVISKASVAAGGADEQITIVTPSGTTKRIEVYIVPADTVDVDPGDYRHDLVLETPIGQKRLQMIEPSRFSIHQPITLTTV